MAVHPRIAAVGQWLSPLSPDTLPHMLSIVATPIGNLGDITERAKQTLSEVTAVICEDTRVTGGLLHRLGLPKKELLSLHGHTDEGKIAYLLDRLARGEHLALVSDAGTPGISDPGYAIVSRCRAANIQMEVIPGPSAFLAALSVSGLPINHFTYLGFLPLKKGRKRLLSSFSDTPHTIVFYESVHRIEKTLHELHDALGMQPDRPVIVCRELTKMHEESLNTYVAQLPEIAARVTKKGEFVIVIGPLPRGKASDEETDV